MNHVYFVDLSLEINESNPFDNYQPFNDKWLILRVVDNSSVNINVGKGKSGIYEVTISKHCEGWDIRVVDFIKYHKEFNKNIILCIDKKDIQNIKDKYKHYHLYKNVLRSYEPSVLIHSTLACNISSILKSGCLRSWNKLKLEGKNQEKQPIGTLLGDPKEFSDYIMLGLGVSCEIVVMSKQLNKIEMNIDQPYQPGGRFYFDTEKIVKDGLLVRDGIHYKVKNELPLDNYLICLITKDDIQLKTKITPRIFASLADKHFKKKHNISL